MHAERLRHSGDRTLLLGRILPQLDAHPGGRSRRLSKHFLDAAMNLTLHGLRASTRPAAFSGQSRNDVIRSIFVATISTRH